MIVESVLFYSISIDGDGPGQCKRFQLGNKCRGHELFYFLHFFFVVLLRMFKQKKQKFLLLYKRKRAS